MQRRRAADHRRMPWKNGGGETVEIAIHPPGADLAGFDWRVSMASVAADGPFSRFDGIDRTLAVLTGAGMTLQIEGRAPHELDPGSAPLAFPADVPAEARLHAGPVTDLNVMTRRTACTHRLDRIDHAGLLHPAARWTLLLPRTPLRVSPGGAPAIDLEPGDALILDGPAPPIRLDGGTLFVATIEDCP